MLTKTFKLVCRLVLGLLALLLLLFNCNFHYSPDFDSSAAGAYNEDVHHQLLHLKNRMHDGAAVDMQAIFPEGFLFMSALYGLAWADLVSGLPINELTDEEHTVYEAHEEIDWALANIASNTGRRPFREDLPLPYGVFYRGWENVLLGRKVRLLAPADTSSAQVLTFRQNSDAIAAAFDAAPGTYLESYRNAVWPADNVVAIASLAAHDRHFNSSRYKSTIENWLTKVKANLDPTTGLVPHHTDVRTGAVIHGARGSSQSLMLSLLPDIDSAFAAGQFAIYEKLFVTERLGLPGVREYPLGTEGGGDIDSGPVIWGIGGAASLVGQRAAAKNGRHDLYLGLRNSVEAFGLAHTLFGRKKYLFGQLPIADAFIAWSNAVEHSKIEGKRPVPWLIHGVSLLVLGLMGWIGYKI